MPLKNGELNLGELKRLVKKYNELMSINTKGMSRPQVIQAIDKAGYNINHKEQKLELKLKQKVKKMPKIVKMPEKQPKTQLQKQKAQEKKAEKEAMKKKQEREIRKKAVEEEKERQSKAYKDVTSIKGNREKKMGDTKFIKKQKTLQLQKQKETRRALLKSKPAVDKTTRRGKPIKKSKKGIDLLDTEEWKSIKDRKWKPNVLSKIKIFSRDSDMNIFMIKSVSIKGKKFIIKYKVTDKWVERNFGRPEVRDEEDNKEIEKELKRTNTSSFTIPSS